MDFVCFSINNWEKRRARKQHFMLHLSKRDDVGKVLYVEPALNFWRLIFFPISTLKTKENKKRWLRALLGQVRILEDGLMLFTPIFFVPFAFRFKFIYNLNLFITMQFICLQLKRLGFKKIVLWLYHPFDYCLLSWFREKILSVFDWAEDWAEYYSSYSQKKRNEIGGLEKVVIAKSDIVFVVSKRLLDRAKKINKNSYKIGDGTIPEIFLAKNISMPHDIKDIKRPIIGYIGAISFRLDIELLKELCEKFTEYSFVFVGNMLLKEKDIEILKSQENVFFLGTKDYNDLPGYLNNFDVNILPYVPVPYTSAPTKVFDYLATGKPVVSAYFSELEQFTYLIRLAKNKEEFIAFLKEALNENDLNLREERVRKAKENSWFIRADEIVNIIYKRLNVNGKQ